VRSAPQQVKDEQSTYRQLDAWHERARRKRGLLNITVVVLRVPVEHKLADGLHRELGARPDLCHVEGVEVGRGGLQIYVSTTVGGDGRQVSPPLAS
jgi:hypothetical protein